MDENNEEKYVGDKLEDVISDQIDYIATLQQDSDEYRSAIDDLNKLFESWLEINRIISDNAKRDIEEKKEKRNSWIQLILGVSGLAIPAVVYMLATHKVLKFEETGTIASLFGRGLIGKLKPTKF